MPNHMPEASLAGAKKIKVLLVEDDPVILRMYRRKLESEGFEVLAAGNGEEGLAALRAAEPDIVLSDIMMPKVSGLDMLKAAKCEPEGGRCRTVPIVMLTNLGDRAEDVECCKRLGAADYWVKANLRMEDMAAKILAVYEREGARPYAA